MTKLFTRDNDQFQPASDDLVIQTALAITKQRMVDPGIELTSPTDAKDFLQLQTATLEHEVFIVIFLNNRHCVIDIEEMFRGTIDGASVYPREVVKAALAHNACAVMFAHNHPSGIAEPSQADRTITARLKKAMALVDIRVLDHFIVAGDEVLSFAEKGLL